MKILYVAWQMDFVCSPNSKDVKPWSSDPLSVLRRRRSDTAEFMEGLCDMNLREETLGQASSGRVVSPHVLLLRDVMWYIDL